MFYVAESGRQYKTRGKRATGGEIMGRQRRRLIDAAKIRQEEEGGGGAFQRL